MKLIKLGSLSILFLTMISCGNSSQNHSPTPSFPPHEYNTKQYKPVADI